MSVELDKQERGEEHATSDEYYFNTTIGCIEDMFIADEFIQRQNNFMDKHWTVFDDNEENKLEYTEIFKEYQVEIEEFIDGYLRKRIDNFDMTLFVRELEKRKGQLNGEIFEILFTITDFLCFKEMILDYKAMKEGRTLDPTNDIFITKMNTALPL